MRTRFLSCLAFVVARQCAAQALPAEFDHNRIQLVAHAKDGSTLSFVVDSGGGFNAIARPVVDRLKLASVGSVDEDGMSFRLVEFPAVAAQAGVPPPLPGAWQDGRLAVASMAMLSGDGFLGSTWFADRTWRIDYGRHEMALLKDWKPGAQDREIPLGFQTDPDGRRLAQMPRMTIAVDGKPLDVLLDTGATVTTTDESASAFGVAPGSSVGGSFIIKSIFDDWHARHPLWRVIERGDGLRGKSFPMIEVPLVTVAGFAVGPVWFAQRPDANFTETMSSMMDKPVVGAFGGSGLQFFHVVLDYPRAVAWFGTNAAAD